MKFVKHFKQQTVRTNDPREFDALVNEIFIQAAQGGKEPEVHFYDSQGFCATIRYFVNLQIPETISEEFELRGEKHYCAECQYFSISSDRRYKYGHCSLYDKRRCGDTPACDALYSMIQGGELYGPDADRGKYLEPILDK